MISHIKNIGSLNCPKTPKTTLDRAWRASLARLSRYHIHASPLPRRLPKVPMVVWAIGCWPCHASGLCIANMTQANNDRANLARQPIGLAPPMLPSRAKGHARSAPGVARRRRHDARCNRRPRACVCASARACTPRGRGRAARDCHGHHPQTIFCKIFL